MLVMITNSIQPYCHDIAHVLGLPYNFRHRFRYRSKWIDPACTPETLENKPTLLVLRNKKNAEFVPIRYAIIEKVMQAGDINYIDFSVKNYSKKGDKENLSNAIIVELKTRSIANEPDKELSCLLFNVGMLEEIDISRDDADPDTLWSNSLENIGQLECYEDFGFLRIMQVRDRKGRPAILTQDSMGLSSYKLESDESYFLEVIQHIPWKIDVTEAIETPYDVVLKAETGVINVFRNVQKVVGKYDLLRFVFKTPSVVEEKHTFLELENKQEIAAGKFRLPTVFIPITIDVSWLVPAIRRIRKVTVAAAFLAWIGSNPIADFLGAKPEWVRDLALLMLVAASGNKWEEVAAGFVKKTKDIEVA
jgi:hypothetical protein